MTKDDDSSKMVLADLSGKTDDELRAILDHLYQEEERLSFERRMLHGKIDILRAELVARLKQRQGSGESLISAKDLEKLTEILAGGTNLPKSNLFGK